MNLKISTCAMAASVITLGAFASANAATISFKFVGVGTGTDGATAFATTPFEIDGTADTTAVAPFPGQPNTIYLPFTTASMTLAGFATNGAITPALDIYSFAGGIGLEALQGGAPSYNLIDFRHGAFSSEYNLISNFGPVTQSVSSYNQFADGFTLNGEDVRFSNIGDVTFTATTASPGVPEPATWTMMLLGFVGLGASLRNSRRRLIA